jgi:hypothetical protein
MTFDTFCEAITKLAANQIWRHNEAGDLQGDTENIDATALRELTAANVGKRGYTSTHYVPTGGNAKAISEANAGGFTINLSANSLTQADEFLKLKIGPVVVVVNSEERANFKTPGGNRVVICPNVITGIQCKDCKACQIASRRVIIGFPAHGQRKRMVNEAMAS